jgi:hypothetical protein
MPRGRDPAPRPLHAASCGPRPPRESENVGSHMGGIHYVPLTFVEDVGVSLASGNVLVPPLIGQGSRLG